MDLNEIKQIIEIDGGKFIIVEDGKPIMVVTGFEDYKKKLIEKRNPVELAKVVRKPVPKEFETEPLKLEDLPL